MEREVILRMNMFTADFLGIPLDEAVELRRSRMPSYGTTLEWLMCEHALLDVERYYLSVHPEGEESILALDPDLRPFLESIEIPKAVFTNAPLEHAQRVLRKLELEGIFDRVFDIRFSELRGKPNPEAFLRVCAALGLPPEACVFIDDIPRYVQGFINCGGHGLLIDELGLCPHSEMPRIQNLYQLEDLLKGSFFGG